MLNDTCGNCGADNGLHHYQTNQCPLGGREAPIGRKQEWMTTTFIPAEAIANVRQVRAMVAEINEKTKRIEQLEAMLATIVSIPAVRDIEMSLMTIPESSNPITDARKMVAI